MYIDNNQGETMSLESTVKKFRQWETTNEDMPTLAELKHVLGRFEDEIDVFEFRAMLDLADHLEEEA